MGRLTEIHFGARKRWMCLYDGRDITVHEALAEREQETGRKLTGREKRDFFRGWRIGKARYAVEDIERYLRYANAAKIDAIAEELWNVARKYGLAKSYHEMTEE